MIRLLHINKISSLLLLLLSFLLILELLCNKFKFFLKQKWIWYDIIGFSSVIIIPYSVDVVSLFAYTIHVYFKLDKREHKTLVFIYCNSYLQNVFIS